jgi:hypothetical protein
MYYHLSRRFHGALNIPVAVLRTIDKKEHQKWVKEALGYLDGTGATLIHQNWQRYDRAHQRPQNFSQVFSTNGQLVFGALMENSESEFFYSEINGRGSYEKREERFLSLQPFLRLADPRSITEINANETPEQALQNMVQMQDLSTMILFDYLLNQADRIGNIHYILRHYALEGEQVKVSNQSFPGSTPIKQMILKDNDCGIIKENRFKKFGVLEKIRHMSPKTYKIFMEWAREIRQPEVLRFLQKEVLLSEGDLHDPESGLLANVDQARQILTKLCRQGDLKLDLSLPNKESDLSQRQDPCEE